MTALAPEPLPCNTSHARWRNVNIDAIGGLAEPALVALLVNLAIDTAEPLMRTLRGRDSN